MSATNDTVVDIVVIFGCETSTFTTTTIGSASVSVQVIW